MVRPGLEVEMGNCPSLFIFIIFITDKELPHDVILGGGFFRVENVNLPIDFGIIIIWPVLRTLILGRETTIISNTIIEFLLTLPFSTSLVVITMTLVFCCQIILQKSLTMLGRHPWVAMYLFSLPLLMKLAVI